MLDRLSTPLRAVALAAFTAAALPSCETIGQMNLIPVEQDPILGGEAYPQLLENETIISSGADHDMVVRMTDKLVAAAQQLDPEIASAFEWEVRLVNKDLVNAWCLPGGKMAVYTGILPVAGDTMQQRETGLAVVMGHEIAHATLRHGTRAMSRQMGTSTLVGMVGMLLGDGTGAQLTAAAAGLGANLANLSYGRGAELEADRRGLRYMATAGYDPSEAVTFWQRMQAASGGESPPAWLSTHPSNDKRIQQIRELLPEVLPIYQQSAGLKRAKLPR